MNHGERLMLEMSEAICRTITPGAIAVLVEFGHSIVIMQFEAYEHDEAARIFAPYFELTFCAGWRNVFRYAFESPLPKRHISTILITSRSVESGVVYPLSEVN
jgi:hypothetical protein